MTPSDIELFSPDKVPEATPQMTREAMFQASADPRLAPRLAVAKCSDTGEIIATLPLIRLRERNLPLHFRPDRVRESFVPAEPNAEIIHLGALHRLKGGGTGSPTALAELVAQGTHVAEKAGLRVAALSVPENQLAAYWSLAVSNELVRDSSWYSLRVNGPDVEDFISSLPRGPRLLWRRERRDLVELRNTFRLSVQPATPEMAMAARDLLNTVLVNNGGESSPELAGARVSWWLELSEGTKVATMAHDPDGNLVALGVGRIYDRTLEMNAFGAVADHPLRRTLYHALLYTMPLEIAVQRGLKTLDLGATHGLPKRLRGCSAESLYTLLPRHGAPHLAEKELSCPTSVLT